MRLLFIDTFKCESTLLFQSFPTEAVQNDSEWLILPVSQLFQSFPTEAVQNDSGTANFTHFATFLIFSH